MNRLLLLVTMCITLASYGVTKDDYAMKFSVTIADGVGGHVATDAVIPIRLSESSINGFSYSDFQETDGTDLYIVDGNDTRLDYEIDMWNPSGETTIWVKVPRIAARTVLTVYYKGAKNTDNVPNNVWSLFLGVWHFNETSVNGTVANAYEATGNSALTGYDTPKTTSVDGRFGLARQPRSSDYANSGVGGVFLPAMQLNDNFVISAWVKVFNPLNMILFSTRDRYDALGMNYMFRGRATFLEMLGDGHQSGWNSASTGSGFVHNEWNRLSVVHSAGSVFNLYVNGSFTQKGNAGASTVTDSTREICVGNASCEASKNDEGPGCYWKKNSETGPGYSFCGQMDEIRIQSYENFDAEREYFEGAIAKDASLTVYSPAAGCDSLVVGLSFAVVKSAIPAEINYTATVDGATGECTYSWDFDNDGTIDRVGSSATETWECDIPGKYQARVSVVDSAGVSGEITTLDYYIVNGVFYVDGGATLDGNGTELSPFNNLRTLSQKMNDGDRALIRGTFIVGDEADPIDFTAGSISIDKWGGEKPLIKSETTEYKATNGILAFDGANVAISNLTFSFTKESFKSVNAVRFRGNDVEVVDCDFSAFGGTCAKSVGASGVLAAGTSQRRFMVKGCTFDGFRAGNENCCAVLVNEDASVIGCRFENVSSAIRANNGSGGGFNFISNIVINAESQATTGDAAGVVIKGGWSYFSGSTIAYNRFINTNETQKAGCVIICPSKTGQNGINAHHNTVVGYKAFAVFDSSTQEPWTFTFFDNLVLGCDYFFKDEKATATYATQKDGCIRNNYHTGAFREVPDGYTFSERMVVDGNVIVTKTPDFLRTKDPSSPDFYRPKVNNRRDPLVIGGWTDDDRYPAYVGALRPSTSRCLMFVVR